MLLEEFHFALKTLTPVRNAGTSMHHGCPIKEIGKRKDEKENHG